MVAAIPAMRKHEVLHKDAMVVQLMIINVRHLTQSVRLETAAHHIIKLSQLVKNAVVRPELQKVISVTVV